MWRLIAFIIIFAVFLAFIVFNLENKCDVSFGIKTIENIPVFLTAFSSFVLGMLFAVPFVLSFGKKRKKNPESDSSGLHGHRDDQPGGKKKRLKSKRMNSSEESGADASNQESPETGQATRGSSRDSEKITRDEAFKLADQIKRENNFNGIF